MAAFGGTHRVGEALEDPDRLRAPPRESRGDPVEEKLFGTVDDLARQVFEAEAAQERGEFTRRSGGLYGHLSPPGVRRTICGAWPRLYTMIVRLNVTTTFASWL